MKSTPVRVIQALGNIRHEDGNTHGTNDLIEAIRGDFHLNYEAIATAGSVSVAGLGRWRKNNYGETPRVAALIDWANARTASGDDKTSNPSEAVRNISLGEIEAHLSKSLKMLLGENAVQAVKVAELKPSEEGQLTLILRVV